MIILSYTWMLLLLPLPLLLKALLPAYLASRPSIRVPWFERIAGLLGETPKQGAVVMKPAVSDIVLFWLMWLLLVIAIARPQLLEPPVSRVIPTRDLLLLVDLSGSMDTLDFTSNSGEVVSRLDAVKEVLDDFLTRREGDNVALVVFGNAPFVQVPFTQDLEVSRILLNETAVRMAGPRTAFGDAIGLGINLFEDSQVEEKVIIALTDGNDTDSDIPPHEAAQIARDHGITIHVVGVGNPEASGEEKLDETALSDVAEISGGQYFHADDRVQLETIYDTLDSIGAREVETESYRPRIDLYYWPMAALLVLSLLYTLTDLMQKFVKNRVASQ